MKEISRDEFKSWQAENKEFQLIDVREVHEHQEFNIGAELMPLSSFTAYVDKIRDDIPVVIHCRSGARSAQAINFLQQQRGLDNLYNLVGGVLDWN